jgi:hypothetical protein
MYSPKIDERLIPTLYRIAKAKGIKMTTLVNSILQDALRKTAEGEDKNKIKPEVENNG